jgi:hypothetical protein
MSDSKLFGDTVLIEPCSECVCSQGHKWAPQLALAKCPGCSSQVLALRLINCPVCNEPQKSIKFRTDHVVGAPNIVAACRGPVGASNIAFVTLDIHHSENAEKYWNQETGRVEPPLEAGATHPSGIVHMTGKEADGGTN